MSRVGRLCLFAALLAGTGAVQAQRSAPEDPVRPDEIRQLAGRLKGLDPGVGPLGLDQGLLKRLVEDLRKANPGKSDQQIADDLRKKYGLKDPAKADQLADWVRKQLPAGGPGRNQSQRGSPPTPDRRPSAPPATTTPPVPPPETAPELLPKLPPADLARPDRAPTVGETGREAPPSPPFRTPPTGYTPDRAAAAEPTPNLSADRLNQYKSVARWWEKNIGPLSDTPAVRNILQEMLTGRTEFGGQGAGPLGELFESVTKTATGSDVAGLMPDSLPGLSGWNPPEVDTSGWTFGPSRPDLPGGPSFSIGGGGSWLPVILFVAVAAVGLVLFWLWPRLTGAAAGKPAPVAGLGPWPIDPRSIADRDGLVRAFEYLSVLVNGADARTWNHRTIADGFRRNVPGAAGAADELATAYALARYSPAGQPVPAEVVAAAREHLCRIAGVGPA